MTKSLQDSSLTKEQQNIYDTITKEKNAGKPVGEACREHKVKPHVWSYIQWKVNQIKSSKSKSANYAKIAASPAPTKAPLSQMVLVRGTPEQIREFLGGQI